MDLHIRLPKMLGDTVASTAVLKTLRGTFPDKKLIVYTHVPDLVQGLDSVDEIHPSKSFVTTDRSVDLLNFLEERDPLNAKPYRHLIDHMYEVTEDSLRTTLTRNHVPSFTPEQKDLEDAKKILEEVDEGKPVIWLQKKTSTPKKDWLHTYWREFEDHNKSRYTFLELDGRYGRRADITVTQMCAGGITLDTFLSHGSQAVGASNVVVILMSTRPEVVTYPNQHVLYEQEHVVSPDLVTETLRKLV
ncbi:MAG: hypothetical protein AAB460_02020 [Patescibacteria group bacterium]